MLRVDLARDLEGQPARVARDEEQPERSAEAGRAAGQHRRVRVCREQRQHRHVHERVDKEVRPQPAAGEELRVHEEREGERDEERQEDRGRHTDVERDLEEDHQPADRAELTERDQPSGHRTRRVEPLVEVGVLQLIHEPEM